MSVPSNIDPIFQKLITRGFQKKDGNFQNFSTASINIFARHLRERLVCHQPDVNAWLQDFNTRVSDIRAMESSQRLQIYNLYCNMLRANGFEDKIDPNHQAVKEITDIDVQQRASSSQRTNELTIDGIRYLASELHRIKPYSSEAALAQLIAALEGNLRGPLAAAVIVDDTVPTDTECAIVLPAEGQADLVWQHFKNAHSFGQRRFKMSHEISDYLRESVKQFPRSNLIQKHDRADRVITECTGFTVNDFRRAAALHSADMSTEDRVERAELALHSASTRLHQYVSPNKVDFQEQKERIDEFIAKLSTVKRRASQKRKADEQEPVIDPHTQTRLRMQAIRAHVESLEQEFAVLEAQVAN